MDISECYKILKVPPGANWNAVKASYYDLVKLYHPDRYPTGGANEDHILKLNLAFNTLKRIERMRVTLSFWRRQMVHTRDLVKVLDPVPWIFDPLTDQWDQVKRSAASQFKRCLRTFKSYYTKLFPLDVYKSILLERTKLRGNGNLKIKTLSETFQIKIPVKLRSGLLLQIPSKGEAGLFHKRRGDLFINIKMVPPFENTPQTGNVQYDVQVSREILQKKKVLTLQTHEGPIKFFLPKNTINGQTFVLKSRPKNNEIPATSHIVTVHFLDVA